MTRNLSRPSVYLLSHFQGASAFSDYLRKLLLTRILGVSLTERKKRKTAIINVLGYKNEESYT
jgi:hypothetical protein